MFVIIDKKMFTTWYQTTDIEIIFCHKLHVLQDVFETKIPYDPEGILGTFPSIFLCVLGLQVFIRFIFSSCYFSCKVLCDEWIVFFQNLSWHLNTCAPHTFNIICFVITKLSKILHLWMQAGKILITYQARLRIVRRWVIWAVITVRCLFCPAVSAFQCNCPLTMACV